MHTPTSVKKRIDNLKGFISRRDVEIFNATVKKLQAEARIKILLSEYKEELQAEAEMESVEPEKEIETAWTIPPNTLRGFYSWSIKRKS